MTDTLPTRPYARSFRGFVQRAAHLLGRVLLRLFVRLRVVDAPDLAQLGAVILAPNHSSFLDPPVLQLALRHHVTFLMTEMIYQVPLARWFFKLWEAVPVPEGRNAASAIKGALEALKRQRPVTIFPEGGISNDGYIKEGRGGVMVIALRARVPVIPVAILGAFDVLPRHRRWPRPGTITVKFGAPIAPPDDPKKADPNEFAARVMSAIAALGAPQLNPLHASPEEASNPAPS